MKYLYVGIAILALCLALCVTTTCMLTRYTKEASQMLEEAQTHAAQAQYDAATRLVSQSNKLWKRHHGFFGIILRHDEADDVNAMYQRLLAYAEEESSEEFLPTCAELIQRIHHLADMELPHYYNVLSHCAAPQNRP